jgi:RNA polymerase sigma-70 factor (ECF subfamily)
MSQSAIFLVSFSERNCQLAEAERQDTRGAADTAAAGKTLTPEMLVREHAAAVLGFCIAFTKSVHDGEDIMQDVFLQAFAKLETLREPERVRPWLLKIAKRRCIDHFRKNRPSQSLTEARDVPSRPDYSDEHIHLVNAAVSKLPEGYRQVVTLYYLDGCNCSSVARSLGIREAAVRRRLVRARLMLHELIGEDKS